MSELKQRCFHAAAMADALGVPHEFKRSEQINPDFIHNPALITKEYSSYPNVPVGYFSDDFSQILCVENCLNNPELNFNEEMLRWSEGKYWNDDKLFDIGIQTYRSLTHYSKHNTVLDSGTSSGNGSLMRMLPIAFLPYDQIGKATYDYSILTHNSPESLLACHFYAKLVHGLVYHEEYVGLDWSMFNKVWFDVEHDLQWMVPSWGESRSASGYCIDSLNLAYECLHGSTTFDEAITKCIMHGGDTDTNASILAPLAALMFGMDDINPNWIEMMKINENNTYYMKVIQE